MFFEEKNEKSKFIPENPQNFLHVSREKDIDLKKLPLEILL